MDTIILFIIYLVGIWLMFGLGYQEGVKREHIRMIERIERERREDNK